MKNIKVVFMGTPEFAVPSLDVLVSHGWNIAGVVTAPDKPRGRGREMGISPVKKYALEKGLHILQPTNLKSPMFLESLEALKADLQVVVAFRMLPQAVWRMPSLGTFNLHGSLLPKYRGAAPINRAIMNGEKETGVTTFFLNEDIDTGHILFSESEPIYQEDNAGTLYERLMHKGSNLVLKTAEAIAAGQYSEQPQQFSASLPQAPRIFKETCEIDFGKTGPEIVNFVRGLAPYPGAWTTLHGKTCKIFKVKATQVQNTLSIESDGKTFLHLGCTDGFITVEELQIEGKKRMGIEEFLRGYKL